MGGVIPALDLSRRGAIAQYVKEDGLARRGAAGSPLHWTTFSER